MHNKAQKNNNMYFGDCADFFEFRKEMGKHSVKKTSKIKCLRLEGSNFRLGGIAPITRAVPSFRASMRLAVWIVRQKEN